MSDAPEAFGFAGKRPSREVADIVHRVPAGLNAADVGYNFINEAGNGHCGMPFNGGLNKTP